MQNLINSLKKNCKTFQNIYIYIYIYIRLVKVTLDINDLRTYLGILKCI